MAEVVGIGVSHMCDNSTVSVNKRQSSGIQCRCPHYVGFPGFLWQSGNIR